MDHSLPSELEARIRFYEQPGNDPGRLGQAEWRVLLLAGVALPIVCLILGWFVGWPS